jgi:stage II sporulation protein D
VTAVTETKNKIIVDSASNIIIAAYHNNCGGETAAAEDVWSKPLPYLQPVQDPFCRNSLHASWEKKISLKDWLNYLQKKKPATICTDIATISDTTFCHFPAKREALLSFPNVAISSRSIRDDWRFRSAYFTINQSGDTLIFNGRGFGHGVGLCQEGAMQMAKYGYSYQEIINFYYKNVFIVDDKEIHSLYVSR